ncbi:Auxilin-related protein 2 [Vitis vinifera]|uniref:Auxilin-related protein 2 n=1 Tax=Vitis vinifera TaxID=29760 RepID=A0A438FG67_VITVI|nr:Auxilin-related protein 2 [Vitis vinifera]
MRHLLEFIQELELKNHPLAGGSFTWSGGLNDQFASRWRRDKEMRNAFKIFQFILIIPSLVVLWPECGWQPVSLTNLITAASVKKVYRKATLCIHPDKVQQKGANLQQKYIAEKVFNLLKVLLSDI